MVYAIDIQNKFTPAQKLFNIGQLTSLILPLMMAGAAIIFLVMMLLGALKLMRSGDSPDGIKKAYSTIVFAVIGLFIVIASFVGVRLIGALLGINNILP
jgi:hypothetical protein